MAGWSLGVPAEACWRFDRALIGLCRLQLGARILGSLVDKTQSLTSIAWGATCDVRPQIGEGSEDAVSVAFPIPIPFLTEAPSFKILTRHTQRILSTPAGHGDFPLAKGATFRVGYPAEQKPLASGECC